MKKICCLALLVVLFGILSAQSALCTVKKFGDLKHKGGKLGSYNAIIIGIDRYQDSKIPELNGVSKCAKTFAKTLKTTYGFSTELLINKNATKENLLKKIESLASSVDKSGMVLIYFVGRGEGMGALAPVRSSLLDRHAPALPRGSALTRLEDPG